jgi:hypothetical protein
MTDLLMIRRKNSFPSRASQEYSIVNAQQTRYPKAAQTMSLTCLPARALQYLQVLRPCSGVRFTFEEVFLPHIERVHGLLLESLVVPAVRIVSQGQQKTVAGEEA